MHGSFLGLHDIEFIAFDSLTEWIKQRSGARTAASAVMQCLLSVEPNAYFTNRQCLGAPIRKVLTRVLKSRNLFSQIQQCDQPLRTEDLFTSELCNVLYPITESGIKIECPASEESWAYHAIVNGLVCPSTRETIVGFARGQPAYKTRANQSLSNLDDLKIPTLFKMPDGAADVLMDSMLQHFELLEWPFDFLETLEFEQAYEIPQERCFSRIYLQNIATGPLPLIHLNNATQEIIELLM